MTRNYLLLSAVAAAAAVTTSVSAQEADQGAQLEEIVVTGSYLYTGIDSPSPVVVISGDELVMTAPADLGTYFFDNVTQNASNDPQAQITADGQSRARSIRTANINLRGLGSENTLVLLNGRRFIENPVPDFGGWRAVDINSLVPRIAIGRADLLLDGGSATFGSDAVAGVVNTITRNDFEGFDFAMDGRFFEEEAGSKNITLAALWGAGNDTSHIIAAVEWHETDRLSIDIATGDFSNDPNVLPPPSGIGLDEQDFLGAASTVARGRGPTWGDPDCGNPAFGPPILRYYQAYEGDNDEVYAIGTGPEPDPNRGMDFCAQPNGFTPNQILQNDTEQLSFFIAASHDFSDKLTASVELNMARQRFKDIEFWGDRNARGWIPDQPSGLGTEFAMPADHPGLAWIFDTANTYGYQDINDFAFDQEVGLPFGVLPATPACTTGDIAAGLCDVRRGFTPAAVQTQGIYQLGETLPFLYQTDGFQEQDLWRAAFTLEGEINGDWSWKTDATAAYSTVRNGARDLVKRRYPEAIQGLGGPNCDPATGTAGADQCYWYNPFMSSALPDAASIAPAGAGASQTGLANNREMVDWLTPMRTDIFNAEFYSFDALVTGFFGDLPGGPIGLAIGAGVRQDFVERNADQIVNAGETATLGVFNDWGGKQKISSVYTELALPVRADLDIQLAARYEDYQDGFSQVTPKIATLWAPRDDLVLRASWGQSFKGPSTVHLSSSTIFQGMASGQVTVFNPNVNGGENVRYGNRGLDGAGSHETRANPLLEPQESDNWSLGFDWDVTDNISFGATYVGINFTDIISSPTYPQTIGNLNCILTTAAGIPANLDGSELFVQPIRGARPRTDELLYHVEVGGETAVGGACIIPRDEAARRLLPPTTDVGGRFEPTIIDNHALAFTSPRNIAFLETEQLDLRASMFWDTPIGLVSFTPNVTIVLKFDYPTTDGSENNQCPGGVCDGVGRTVPRGTSGVQSMARWRGTLIGGLSRGDHNFRLTARYTDSINPEFDDLSENQKATFVHDSGLWTADVSWFWSMTAASSLNLSIRNVFAQDPPENNRNGFFNRNRRTFTLQYAHSFAN